MAWGDLKRVSGCEALLSSMTMKAARKVRLDRAIRPKWERAPRSFWTGVRVGCRMRMAWVVRKMPVELRSLHRHYID